MGELKDSHAELESQFAVAEAERDELYDSFTGAVRKVQQRTDFRNLILEKKVRNRLVYGQRVCHL